MKTKLFLAAALCVSLSTSPVMAQGTYRPAIYPTQQESAGQATMQQVSPEEGATHYTLANQLFTITYRHADGQLTLVGSPELNVRPSDVLFTLQLGNGSTTVTSAQMQLTDVHTQVLSGSTRAVRGSHHFDGQALVATYQYRYSGSNITATWMAELRDGSHYVKTDLTLSTDRDVQMHAVLPMQYTYDAATAGSVPEPAGNTWGTVLMSDRVFCGLETPMGRNSVLSDGGNDQSETPGFVAGTWQAADFSWQPSQLPAGITALGYNTSNVIGKQGYVSFAQAGKQTATFLYRSGNLRLDIAGVDLVEPETGQVVASDYHHGYSGGQKVGNVYTLQIPQADHTYMLRYYIDTKTDGDPRRGTSAGDITWSTTVTHQRVDAPQQSLSDVVLQGLWSRSAKLTPAEPWNVSAILGVVDPQQPRRTILAYSERERAVPWRPFPHYNSWYELNIDRNNASDPAQNLNVQQCVDVISHWKQRLFDPYGVGIQAFVWDDGWDNYGLWTPHAGFPNGFDEPDAVARQMCSGIGAWLGPCGGYGGSGSMRNKYWTDRGGQHRLSYEPFYRVFKEACGSMVSQYDFRYFKFDGISQQYPHPVGPDENTAGIENCEGIIRAERYVREQLREDIFFNTTVGTWASPFWFHFSDAVWRGADDWGKMGNNPNDREAWITYRDQLVYKHFVSEVPYCPINTLMTHGFILTKYGAVSKNMDYKNVRNELRCAFACGSGMVELYCDYALMDQIGDGALWNDLAQCIRWQRQQADVLPDVHWVGGNPWDGTQHNVYGWASWNGRKATLALRNGGTTQQRYTFTLRQALDIPADVHTTISLSDAFEQAALSGLALGQPIDIDTPLTVTLPASSVYVYNGLDGNGSLVPVQSLTFDEPECRIPAGSAMAPTYTLLPLDASDRTLLWSSDNPTVATVSDGAITAVAEGECTITATTQDQSGIVATLHLVVEHSLQNDLTLLLRQAQETYDTNEAVELSQGLITTVSQLSSNASDSSEGVLRNLLDQNPATFWHSNWHSGDQPAHSHYLQVRLSEPVEGRLLATVARRLNNGSLLPEDNPVLMSVEASTDGKAYTQVGQLTLPYGEAYKTVTDYVEVPAATSYLRFWNEQSNNRQRGYWHCGDFQLQRVIRESNNRLHPQASAAMAQALTQARTIRQATQQDIDTLAQALQDYLDALAQEPTAVIAPQTASATQPQAIYDLQGRRVQTPSRGIYIIGGRKVLL